MRVKKLNTNRRVRAGDDDGTSSSATGSPQQIHSPSQWASPTKTSIASYSPESDDGSASNANDPDDSNEFRRGDVIEIGADSPTDPTATPSVQSHEVTELDLDRHYLTTATNTSDMATTSVPTTKTNGPTNVGALVPTENETAATWRDSVDPAVRKGVHEKIVEYLGTLKPNAPPKVLEKLPGLAYRMEENLFKMAASETEYKDQTTLPQRLTLIQQANAKRLLQQQCPPVSPKDKEASASPTRSRKPLNEEQARVVFSCLQSWRQKLVNMYGSTPWEILPNKILAKVAVFIPSTTQELVVCGVAAEPLERFGNSLLQEIEKVMNALNANANAVMAMSQAASRGSSPSAGTKRPAASSKSSTNGQSAAKARGGSPTANKKRKTAAETLAAASASSSTANAVRLAAAAPTFLSPLIRPIDPAFLAAAASSLPALLPSGSTATANGKKPSVFPRIPVPGDQDNRMHLLAQGVGQLSQQQDQQQQQKQLDSEKEIQALRWLLQESQREKALLEAEVQRLRQQGAK